MALSGIQRTFADILDSIWGKDAQTSIPTQPVSGIAYRDTDAEFESGQKYDSLGESSRWNQMLYLLTGLMSELTAFGILPWSAAQPYSKGALCIGSDGTLWQAQIDIAASPTNPVPPGTDDNVWSRPKIFGFVPDSIRVIAGTGMTGGGPLSGDVTLSAKLDGKTTQADAGGVITVKDVAIEGDSSDLASARGQIGDNIRINTASDLNAYTKAGNWLFSDAAAGENFPNIGRGGELNCYVSTTAIFQFFTEFNNNRRYIRYGIPNSTWTNWIQFISVAQLGDGIRVTNGIISVPEYEGATASTAGTSGLVPPATAGQQESFLTGGGEYKPALTKISDSVSLADSTTAASAKAVKTAYDLANSKQANLGFTPVQQGGGAGQEGQKIYIGWSPSGLKAQADALDLGNIVTTSAGCMKAPSAANADYAISAGRVIKTNGSPLDFVWSGQEGQPAWVWGSNEPGTTAYVYSPARFSVNYANSAGSAPANGGTAWATVTVPNVAIGDTNQAVPAGGTWTFIVSRNGAGNMGTIAGGTVINQGVWLAIRVA